MEAWDTEAPRAVTSKRDVISDAVLRPAGLGFPVTFHCHPFGSVALVVMSTVTWAGGQL
ncbi:hypothetical protein ACFC1R_35515 [Kitasatospora sp. NPDC056138]|uniref:hypothetical protein n=1 Tax=Kitasatospora sp. NPDC056138 TaxID=3345724 RepID=UPI0035DB1E1E